MSRHSSVVETVKVMRWASDFWALVLSGDIKEESAELHLLLSLNNKNNEITLIVVFVTYFSLYNKKHF